MNQFDRAVLSAVHKHGSLSTYRQVNNGVYDPNTSSVTNTETNHSVVMYKKQMIANQFSYPHLIGKEAAVFFVCGSDVSFIPKSQDKIVFNSLEFTVLSYQEYSALGKVILYKIVGVR